MFYFFQGGEGEIRTLDTLPAQAGLSGMPPFQGGALNFFQGGAPRARTPTDQAQ